MGTDFVNFTELRKGSYVVIDGVACVVKSVDISKTGKHGHAKVRLEAIGLIDDKKRVLVKPGHEKAAVPVIEKRRGQVLSISGNKASLMDTENFETLEALIPEDIQIKEGIQVEYWDIEGTKIIKRAMFTS